MEAINLQDAFTDLPPLPIVKGDIWNRHRLSIRRHVATSDDLMQFLNWSTITAIMFVGDAPYIEKELDVLRESPDWNRWRSAIKETYLGAPQTLPYYTASSGNLVHQAYHLKMFEDLSGKKLKDMDSIYEFGCGYGAMALVACRAGFFGDYYVYDFPEMLLLTAFYLRNLGVEDVHFVNTLEPIEVDLFVACYSLSEIRLAERKRVLFDVKADNYLFAFQGDWDGVDNVTWFDSFALMRDDYKFVLEEVRHMNLGNTIWYMVGSKR
jgi:hypothetical protein